MHFYGAFVQVQVQVQRGSVADADKNVSFLCRQRLLHLSNITPANSNLLFKTRRPPPELVCKKLLDLP